MSASPFVAGLITMGQLIAGLFFLRFWTRTRDRLFLAFAASFWLLAINQALLALTEAVEERSWIYLLRVIAFLLIIVAVIAKNGENRR